MPTRESRRRIAVTLVSLGIYVSALWLFFVSFRITGLILFGVMVGLTVATVRGSSPWRAAIAFVLFVLATLLPIDISFHSADGPPHLVPYVMGYPSPEMSGMARRGEVVLGGCVINGFEPKWVLVW